MTDANNKSNTDAVWASAIAEELAARAGGDFIAQVDTTKLIFSRLAIDIKSGNLLVYVMGLAGMEEQKFPDSGIEFPVGDYKLKRATVEFWYASKTTAQAFGQREPSATTDPLMVALSDEERRINLLRELGGSAKYERGDWKFSGIAALVKRERADGHKRHDEKTIRADLKKAAQAEREAKSAGFSTGLGQR